jgi:DNA polymerase-3 subunit alpha
MAALLTSETGNTDKVVKYINECRDLHIQVLPPDVNKSNLNFTPDHGAIRFGLGAVKNVGAGAVEAIVAARKEGGKFTSLDDFCRRADMQAINRRVIESLIKAGAMDALAGRRSQLFAVIEDCIQDGQRAREDRESGQGGLFEAMLAAEPAQQAERSLPNVPDWTPIEKLRGEKEMLGFYVTGHPMDEYKWKVDELSTHLTDTLHGADRGAEVTVCGVMTTINRRRNKEGKLWASMQLEDWKGAVEALCFATKYELLQNEIVDDRAVMVRAKALPEDDGTVKLSIQEIIPLEVARVPFPSMISVRVRLTNNGSTRVEELQQLFERKPGRTEVRLRIERPRDFALILDVPCRIQPDKEFKAEIERICGPEALEVLAS